MITNSKYSRFTSKEIKPRGWLKRQLRIQAESLSGNLDKMWPDIRDSKWIGGDKDGWERVPYWLDGFIPLAYLLEDEDLIKRAQKYVEAIIAGQQPDGWICPCSDGSHMWYDMWAMFLLCKVLVVYYECTGDDRIEEVIYKVLKQYSVHSRNVTLFFWGHARWFECLIAVDWLYRRRPEKWIKELAVTLSAYGYNYKSLIKNFQDTEKQEFWSYRTHIVNLAMAYKSEALMSGITGEDPDEFAQEMYETLMKYHGSAVGYIAGDECLAGKSPIQATELCSRVEAMFSFEKLFEITGNTQWADRLEIHAYNALPATISEDMWTHQYLQQVNQIQGGSLLDRNLGGIAIDGSRGREHDGLDTKFLHALTEVQGGDQVIEVVAQGDGHRLANGLEACEVDDALDIGILGEDGVQSLGIAEVGLIELGPHPGDGLDAIQDDLLTVAEIIDNDGGLAGFDELDDGMGTDEAGSAGDENRHSLSFIRILYRDASRSHHRIF